MTPEHIIRMARLYGTPVQEQNAEVEYRFTLEQLGLLVSTVTVLEREACAKLVDYWEAREGEHADAIRERGQQ